MGTIDITLHIPCFNNKLDIQEADNMINGFEMNTIIYGHPVTFTSTSVDVQVTEHCKLLNVSLSGNVPLHLDCQHHTIDELCPMWNTFSDLYDEEIKNIAAGFVMAIILCKPNFHQQNALVEVKFDGISVEKEFFFGKFNYHEASLKYLHLLNTKLTLQETWDWIFAHTSIYGKKNKSPMFFSALSYLLNRENHEALLYAIMGLESIFCSSEKGISFSLQSKIPHIFPTVTPDQIKQLYKLRSKFVHGEKPIGVYFSSEETYEDDEEYEEYAFLSFVLLIESLRILIHNKAETLKFE